MLLPSYQPASYAVGRARTARLSPAELAPAPWPDVPSNDPSGEIARLFVLRLRGEMAGRALRAVTEQTGAHKATLVKILHVTASPDLATVSRLEVGLKRSCTRQRVSARITRHFRLSREVLTAAGAARLRVRCSQTR